MGPGFVCRISGKPASDPCINTPPATAYWSYWWSSNGGPWTYSTKGAANRTVVVGGFEGWSFGNGSARPTSGNPSRPVIAPQPKPTLSLGPAESTTTTSSSHSSSSSSSTSKKSTPSKTTATTGSPTASPTASDPTSAATPLVAGTANDAAGGQLAGEQADSGGSPWRFIVGALALVLIGGGGALIAVRRRGIGGF